MYLPIGVILMAVFIPTLLLLAFGSESRLSDSLTLSSGVLPWALGFCAIISSVGVILTYFGIRYSAFPGSVLYRLTHLGQRRH